MLAAVLDWCHHHIAYVPATQCQSCQIKALRALCEGDSLLGVGVVPVPADIVGMY